MFPPEAVDEDKTESENDQGHSRREQDVRRRPERLVDRKIRVKKKSDRGQGNSGEKIAQRFPDDRPRGSHPISEHRPQQNGDDRRDRAQKPFRVEIRAIKCPARSFASTYPGQISGRFQNAGSVSGDGNEGEKGRISEREERSTSAIRAAGFVLR